MGQHHGADGRGDQQCAGQLERPQISGKDQEGQAFDVSVRVGRGKSGVGPRRHGADRGDQQNAECQAGHHAGDPLSAQRFLQRFCRVHADQHQHEQEQHHHRAGVDHDLNDTQKRRVLDHVQDGQAEHCHRQEHRRVDGVDRHQDSEGAGQCERTQYPERHRFTGRGAGDDVGRLIRGQIRGQQRAHSASPAFWISRRPAEVMLPR